MRTILVTGANRGIGLEFVRQYSSDGDRVIAICRNDKDIDELKAIIPSLSVNKYSNF